MPQDEEPLAHWWVERRVFTDPQSLSHSLENGASLTLVSHSLIHWRKLPCRRKSRDEAPTAATKVPAGTAQLCAFTSQIDTSRATTLNCTSAVAPGCSTAVFWNPLSCQTGSPADAGNCRYSWATSAPGTLPEFLMVALMVPLWLLPMLI